MNQTWMMKKNLKIKIKSKKINFKNRDIICFFNKKSTCAVMG
jgi:hypothetical protein